MNKPLPDGCANPKNITLVVIIEVNNVRDLEIKETTSYLISLLDHLMRRSNVLDSVPDLQRNSMQLFVFTLQIKGSKPESNIHGPKIMHVAKTGLANVYQSNIPIRSEIF